MAGFRYIGTDLDAAPDFEKNAVAVQANNIFKGLDEGYMLHFETVRVPSTQYPSGDFSETVTAIIDHERRRQFKEINSHFETETYCFLTWQPPRLEQDSLSRKILGFLIGEQPSAMMSDSWITSFEQNFESFAYALTTIFNVEILEERDLLSTINLCVNGQILGGLVDLQDSFLDTLFARDIEVGDPLVYDNSYVGIVSIDGFPSSSMPCILERLSTLPFEYRWSNRFIAMDFRSALGRMSKEQRKWAQKKIPLMTQIMNRPTTRINRDAAEQENDINDALQSLHEQSVSYGHYTSTIIIRAEDVATLDSYLKETVRVLNERLFSAKIEHRNAMEAFLGSLPGHGHENVRKPLIHSLNFAHFVMLGSAWPGLVYNPCPFYPPHSPALIQATTLGGNPFRLHLHVGDVGHTAVVGPTGSGKSTLLALIAAQQDRYKDAQIFLFDKGRSMYPLIAAMESANYYYLGADNAPSLCPLSDLGNKAEITWALEFIETMVLLNKGEMTPERRGEIENALLTMSRGTQESKERTLSALVTNIQEKHLKDTLKTYTYAGTYGQYLDGDKTEINYSKVCGFELEDLMSHGEKVVTPTLLYLFHEIEKRIKGQPTMVIIDEAWLALDSPLFAHKIREWLKVLRKGNAQVILATQNLTDILESSIANAVFDSCPTKILLPNPEAKNDSMRAIYQKALGLNEAEIMAIASATPKRDYFYVSPNGRRLFNLNLGDVSLAFVGASGKADLARIDELIVEHGKFWPAEWLRERGQEAWANYWPKMAEKIEKGRSAANA